MTVHPSQGRAAMTEHEQLGEKTEKSATASPNQLESSATRDATVRALNWITGDDTGVSSKAIWARMMAATPDRLLAFGSYPHDPDDFGRCYRLLALIPEWRARIGEMAAEGEVWTRLAAAWDELTALYEQEAGPHLSRGFGWSSPLLYARMKELGT